MARSQGVIIAVKVPIKWESMTKRTQQRLRQIVGRDTRVIRAFLGVIQQHEEQLLRGKNRDRIDDGGVDHLTMTALKVRNGRQQRPSVPHDFKAKFPRMSQNELIECRQTAVAMYESYLKLRRKRWRKASHPCEITSSRKIPRWVFSQRFRLIEHPTSIACWWLDLRDSLDSVPQGRIRHDRLLIPLKTSPFHLAQFQRGAVKALQIFTDRMRKWWVTFAVRVDVNESSSTDLPPAVLGIDLGIKKAVCSTLVTPEKVRETLFFAQKDKVGQIKRYDDLVAKLQNEKAIRQNNGMSHDMLAGRLRELRTKRENIAREYDRVLVRQLLDYIVQLSEKYTLYVSIGRLKNIRNTARKGNWMGRRFRRMIHSWAFSRITESLKHNLAQLGWVVKGKDARFRVVPENWTSIMCWKCGSKGTRPRQNLFVCPNCGHKTNADRNGAINIAGRLIMLTESLHDVRGLGKWAISAQAGRDSRLKARRKRTSSKGKSSLSSKGQTSGLGESAAVHCAQSSLLDFGDDVGESDKDLAVVRTVEKFSVAGSDAPVLRQEKEARTAGGIPSR